VRRVLPEDPAVREFPVARQLPRVQLRLQALPVLATQLVLGIQCRPSFLLTLVRRLHRQALLDLARRLGRVVQYNHLLRWHPLLQPALQCLLDRPAPACHLHRLRLKDRLGQVSRLLRLHL
jgi:hypothetical protein